MRKRVSAGTTVAASVLDEEPPTDDRSLMERIHHGDRRALDEVLERFWAPLVDYAYQLLADRDAAEDVVQEAILRFWDRRHNWTPTQRLNGFLYQTTRNLALNELQKGRVRQRWADSPRGQDRRAPPTPLELTEHAELRALLEGVINDLPPRRREVFLLARFHGQSYRDIAEIMEISPQTVANHLSAALQELRRKLRPHIDELLRGT